MISSLRAKHRCTTLNASAKRWKRLTITDRLASNSSGRNSRLACFGNIHVQTGTIFCTEARTTRQCQWLHGCIVVSM